MLCNPMKTSVLSSYGFLARLIGDKSELDPRKTPDSDSAIIPGSGSGVIPPVIIVGVPLIPRSSEYGTPLEVRQNTLYILHNVS